MREMDMKKKAICFTILFISLIGIGTIYKLVNKPYNKILNSNWDIEIPGNYTEIYGNSTESFLGDGERLHIFEYDNDVELEQCLDFTAKKSSGVEAYINAKLSSISVPVEYMPEFDGEYRYFVEKRDDLSKLYLVYFPEEKKLYIWEHIF